jgi:hypothetical protein
MTHKGHKKEKSTTELSCFEVLDVLFRGLQASPVLWGISKLQFLIKKIKIKFPAVNFLQF